MRKVILWLALLMMIPVFIQAQDIRLDIHNKTDIVTKDRAWSNLNQTWIFRPLEPQNSIYIFIANKNPSSSHNLKLSVYQTPSPTVTDFSNNKGYWVTDVINGSCNFTNIASMSGCWVNTLFASQVAVQITGASSASGSPDTADIYITQAPNEPKSQGTGQFVANYSFENAGITSQSTFVSGSAIINPTSNSVIWQFRNSSTTKNVYLNQLILQSSVNTGIIQVSTFSGAGTGCISLGSFNTTLNLVYAPAAVMEHTCSIAATGVATLYDILGNTTIDLRGFILPANSTTGLIIVIPTAITGTVSAYLSWYEQ